MMIKGGVEISINPLSLPLHFSIYVREITAKFILLKWL